MTISLKLMAINKPLFLITDGGKRRLDGTLADAIVAAVTGAPEAIAAIVIREQVSTSSYKPAEVDCLRGLLTSLKPVCEQHDVKLIVHTDFQFVHEGLADGVHLSIASESIGGLRAELPEESWIGYSAHSIEESENAVRSGADYVFLSPIFPPLSKQDGREPFGLEQLRLACSMMPGRVVALGGITDTNAAACGEAGACGVAGISSVLLAADPSVAARRLASAWESRKTS